MLEREFNCKTLIYDKYKDLLKKDIYEPIILEIMNLGEIMGSMKLQTY